MLFKHLKHVYREQEGDPAGGGGTLTDPNNPPAPPPGAGDLPPPEGAKFTDKDMAAIRRKHERELKIRDKKLEETEARLAALENPDIPPIPAPGTPPTPGVPGDKSAGELELMQKRHEREMEQARKDASEARRIAEDERGKRRNVERDRALADALSLSGVAEKAKPYATTYFRERIEWDEIDGAWVYKTKAGNLVDIADGVSEEMPDMFKRPAATRGGAGTQTGAPPSRIRLTAQLEIEKAKLAEIKKRGGRNNADVLAFTRQERVVKQLEAKVQAT